MNCPICKKSAPCRKCLLIGVVAIAAIVVIAAVLLMQQGAPCPATCETGETCPLECGGNDTVGQSGITGTILLGPTCPVMRNPPDPACADRPYKATIIVKSEDGLREITRFTSGEDGTFRVELAPGTYLLDPQSPAGSMLPRGEQQTVVVEAGQLTDVQISYDSGIR